MGLSPPMRVDAAIEVAIVIGSTVVVTAVSATSTCEKTSWECSAMEWGK
jgi:hypothetical protein